MNYRNLLLPMAGSLLAFTAKSEPRPNILWLTIEDTSAYEFGFMGNSQVKTPNVDSLAARGVSFTNAWSVAPQSSPARSTIITGCYATKFAMDFHRNDQKTPEDIFFPQYLRQAGYYCTNNNKTDYNTSTENKICWDECERGSSYNSNRRPDDQPFFAVFNSLATHMGRIRSFHLEDRRDFRQQGIDPSALLLPPHIPDTPEVRSDYACHLEGVQDIDKWVGIMLKDIEQKGLADNTIVVFYSDHGGCSPRGKGYLNQTGLRVPMIVYLPPRWEHLSAQGVRRSDDRLVSFVDLAPTMLSLVGVEIPKDRFDGAAFMGPQAAPRAKYQYAFTSNQHHNYMPSRAVSDGKFSYIRAYIPYKHTSLRNYYQWGMPSNLAWDSLVLNNKDVDRVYMQPYDRRRAEMLFDLQSDPWEINDLSQDPRYAAKLVEMRQALSAHISSSGDIGFMSPAMRSSEVCLYDKARSDGYSIERLHTLAQMASLPRKEYIAQFAQALQEDQADYRFWAAVGFAELASSGVKFDAPQQLLDVVNDPDDYVAAEGCFALVHLGQNLDEALRRLVTPRREELRKAGYSLLECLALDPSTRGVLAPCLPELQKSAQKIDITYNEDAGMISRGVLVNMGLMNPHDIYGDEGYRLGLEINRGRRAMGPMPFQEPKKK